MYYKGHFNKIILQGWWLCMFFLYLSMMTMTMHMANLYLWNQNKKMRKIDSKNVVSETYREINRVPMTASYKLKHLSAIFSFLCRQVICCCKHFDICCMDINESCQRELKCCHWRCVFRNEIKLINKSIGWWIFYWKFPITLDINTCSEIIISFECTEISQFLIYR